MGESKTHIENTLEQNEHQLGKVLSYANELVTNIQVANEKRELDRIDFQTSVNNGNININISN